MTTEISAQPGQFLDPRSKRSSTVIERDLPSSSYQTSDVDSSSETFDNEPRVPHPRESIPDWKWKMMLLGNGLLAMLNGYDVSNIANIQAPIYEAFGHIELLPWVGLAYSVCNVAVVPLARKLTRFCDFKTLCLGCLAFIMVGAAVGGSAPNIQTVIAGRAIMALGCAVIYQCALSFNVVFAYPHEQGLAQALLGAMFAVGLLTGPLIGGAFAENEHATWRWAFYFAVPFCALITTLLMIGLPHYRQPTNKSAMQHLKEIDWIGATLHAATLVLFAAACIFCGPTWNWSSGSSIAIWTVWGLTLVAYVIQQRFSIGTTPENRIFPCRLLNYRIVTFTWICSICGAISYGVTLYYSPLFFAFVHGADAVEAAIRLLPFIGPFIFTIFFAGGAIPAVRYYQPFYVVAAILILIGAGLFQTVDIKTSEAAVMGFMALIGAGLGLIFNLSPPICSVVLAKSQDDRLDQAALHNMAQLGGTAISLSIAGCIYQNVGFNLVSDVVAPLGDFSDESIRTMLAGVDSPMMAAIDEETMAAVISAIVDTVTNVFYIIMAAGAICFIAACCLKFEALEFRKPANSPHSHSDSSSTLQGDDVEKGMKAGKGAGSDDDTPSRTPDWQQQYYEQHYQQQYQEQQFQLQQWELQHQQQQPQNGVAAAA